MSQLVFIIAYK